MSSINTPGNGGSSASTPYPAGTSGPGSPPGSAGMSSGTSSESESGVSQQRARESIDRISSTAHDTVDRVAARAASMADRMGSSGTQYYDQTREYVVANPMRTLGIAVLAGFLLGRLMR